MDTEDRSATASGHPDHATEMQEVEKPPQIGIRAEIAQRITFATHQCDVPVIADLVISNPLDADIEDLTLHLSSEPKIIGDRVWTIDRVGASGELRPLDRRVSLAGGMLASLNERMRAEVRLELRQRGTVLASCTHPITALAHNEWGGAGFMPELLAAFVLPNDPAVQRLLKEASGLLQAAGKSGSLEGYQARSRKRSWEIVAGIWAAVSRRGLTYTEAPASFGRDGQKIRLPSIVEEQGLATCLDTALLFAAAIEQAGLNPLVVFTTGHALAGAWLQPQTLPTLTVDDPMEIRKAIAQEDLVLFETTMATGGRALTFSRAIAEGKRQVSEARESAFIYAIDIRQARGRDIQPLPTDAVAGAVGDSERSEINRISPVLDEPPDLPPFDIEGTTEDEPQTPAERLDRWKRSLLDLSKRNRLLNLRPSAAAIQIFCPDPALLEDKIAEGKRIRLITPPERKNADGEPDNTLYHLRTGEDFAKKFATEALERNEIVANVDAKTLEKGAIELYRKAKADFEEGGSNTLFLALGMLRWSPPGDAKRSYRAPLILLPVKLERSSAASKPYVRNHEDDPVFNLTLLQMLRQDFHIEIPGLADELPTDEHGVNVRGIWDTVRARIRDVPGFEVVEEVVLSTFSFAKYLMWKDLADRTETLKTSPFVCHVIDTPRDAYENGARFVDPHMIDQTIGPADILAPLNADSSQIVAIHAAGNDGDFVLEGPPGTGKSETIGNIIAHNLGLGRRVLFVSEKMAALDVVYRRLKACGLGDFCLELHSAKSNKRAVLGQLGAAWENRQALTVEEWGKMADRLGEIRDQLNGLVTALHAPGPGGLSPRDAIGRSLRYGDVHRLSLDWETDGSGCGRAPTPEALTALEGIAKRVGQQFSQLQPADIEAFKGIAHTEWSYAWVQELVACARQLGTAIDALIRRRQIFAERLAVPDAESNSDESAAIAEIAKLVPQCTQFNLRFALAPDGRDTLDILEKLLIQLQEYRSSRKALSADYPDDRIVAAPAKQWLSMRVTAKSKLWPLRFFALRKLRREIWANLDSNANSAPSPDSDLECLISLAEQRSSIDKLARVLPENTPWLGLNTEIHFALDAIEIGRQLRTAVTRLCSFGRDLAKTREALACALCEDRERLEAGMPIATAARDLVAAYLTFTDCQARFVGLASIEGRDEKCAVDIKALAQLVFAVLERERRLNVWCAWIAVCREADEAGLGSLVVALEEGAVSHQLAVETFRTAYARWLAPILIDARPELNRFSVVRHEDMIKSFRELDREFARLTSDYIRAKLSTGVPGRDARGADPGYGVLSRELQKRMRHKPVRQLVSEMGAALTTLTPCLMMSPLSVAQFLPTESAPFDLVVFDEASQITVPDAIGAIARGERCIVVGDPQQMPPTRFFERGPEDDENEEVRDLESILDEALAARVPHHRLTGHYRSRHESLICFSNHAYYEGALVTYPSPDTRDTAVTLRRVNGIYAKGASRTNPIEARAVVAEVVRRLRDPQLNHLSIGIVTLNSEQQRLVEDLLDQERRADLSLEAFFSGSEGSTTTERREPVFVKNLETVQGDQRDVILLSIGYGPTEPGAKTMSMNFGPLNRQGGERRLNVAITRATTEVIVFASFDAAMIDLMRTSAEAVKDLKRYLDFAARGPVALGEAIQTVSVSDYDSDFEMAVAERLRTLDWTVRTQVGVSRYRIDLGVVHPDAPGRFLAGIECDGATYHSSPSARDRDRVRHIILEQLGWRLLRVWSTDFFLDPDTSVENLDKALRTLLEADRKATDAEIEELDEGTPSATRSWDGADDLFEESESSDDQSVDSEITKAGHEIADNGEGDFSHETSSPSFAPSTRYHSAALDAGSPPYDPDRFFEPTYRPQLRTMAAASIDSEGPITFKRLSDRIARAHGFQRTGRQISSTLWSVCRRLRRYVATPDGHKVFWPDGTTPEAQCRYRGLVINGERREWREVPHPEKLWLVQQILKVDSSDPVRAVADEIGIARVTSHFRTEIEGLVTYLKLSRNGDTGE